MRKEIERQAFHLVLGTVLAALILILGKFYSLAIFGTAMIAGIVLSELLHKNIRIPPFHWFIQRLERRGVKPGMGTLNFVLGAFIALVFFDPKIVFVSVLILAFGDSFSTIIGKGFGSKRLNNGKSLEGFLGGFIASLFVTLPYLNIYTGAVACFIASFIELVCPVDDNVVIPPVASLIIYMLTL